MKKETGQQHAKRLFQLMDCFTEENPELGVRESARLLNLSSSTTGRMLSQLRDVGVLVQDPETRAYSLGGRVIRWAAAYTANSDIRSKSLACMKKISAETDETVSLYVAEEYDRVCVERLDSRQTVRIVEPVGQRISLFTGSGGKAIMAFRPAEQIEEMIDFLIDAGNTRLKNKTREDIIQELEEIRKTGYAISHGEWKEEASGVAAPIFNYRGIPIGSISISGPSQRFQNVNKLAQYGQLLIDTVSQISRDLGYLPKNA